MSSAPPSQAAMRRRTRIMRVANVPMRAALSLPFATPLSRNLMLISYTGRTAATCPPGRNWSPIPRRPGGRLDPEALAAALRHGFCIVRWHLVKTQLL